MTVTQQFGVALAANLVVNVAMFPVLHWKPAQRVAGLCFLGLLSAASPCAIALEHPTVRLIAAFITSGVLVKLYDLGRQAAAGRVPSLGTYIAFVENSFWHVLSRRPMEHFGNTLENLRLFAINGAAAAIALFLAFRIFQLDWTRWPFALEHVAKVLACYAVLAPAANGLAAGWRLLGQPAMATMNHPEIARTPADFWRRWNRPTQMWLHEHFFLPAGGWRAPIRATLLTFVVSALAHEIVFGVAIGRVQGVQTCFFMLQGLAVIATRRLRLRGWRALFGICLTLTFNLMTARLFFTSVNAALPFYVTRPHP